MAKKFDIHEWQAKRRLSEQDDFTPDLEDDELKKSKVQQMMAKEKDLQQSDYLSDVKPNIEGSHRTALEDLANNYSLSEILDTLADFYAKNDELAAADYADEFAAKFRKWMDERDGGEDEDEPVSSKFTEPLSEEEYDFDDASQETSKFTSPLGEEEIEEQNTLGAAGSGVSFSAGNSDAYTTPNAFAKKGKWKRRNEKYEE